MEGTIISFDFKCKFYIISSILYTKLSLIDNNYIGIFIHKDNR